MKTRFFKGLNEDDKKELEQQHNSCSRYRKQLVKVLNEDVDDLVEDMTKDEHYDAPNWQLVQADRLAQIKAYKKIISLFEK